VVDAAEQMRAEAKALEGAVERIRAGEVVPSFTDRLACDRETCAPIPATEHAAMIALGAWADTLAAEAASRPCSVFARQEPQRPLVRTLRAEIAAAKTQAQAAETALLTARGALAGALKPWDAAVAQTIAEHQSPAANSHADELLGMAVEDLARQSAALNAVAWPYRAAEEAAVAARARLAAATQRLDRHLAHWADIARAVTNAAVQAERGQSPTTPTGACDIGGPPFALSPDC
jgi:hypothetical protein